MCPKFWVLTRGAKALFQVHFPVMSWFFELWSLTLQLFKPWAYISCELRASGAKIRLKCANFHIFSLNLKNSTSQCRNRGAENLFLDFLSCEAWRYSFLNLEPIFHVSWEHQELKFDWNALTFTFFRSTSKIARHNAEIEAQRIYFKTNWHCKIITNAKFSRRERIGTIRHKIPSQSTQ